MTVEQMGEMEENGGRLQTAKRGERLSVEEYRCPPGGISPQSANTQLQL